MAGQKEGVGGGRFMTTKNKTSVKSLSGVHSKSTLFWTREPFLGKSNVTGLLKIIPDKLGNTRHTRFVVEPEFPQANRIRTKEKRLTRASRLRVQRNDHLSDVHSSMPAAFIAYCTANFSSNTR